MTEAKDTAAKFVEAFNAHNESAIRALHGTNIKFEAPGGIRLEGTDAVTGYAMTWQKGFPDAKITVRNQVVDGPWLVQEFKLQGTHTAPLNTPMGPVQPTGKRIDSRGVSVGRYENGQIVEARLYFDQNEVMSQLGLLPEPAATTS
jgi:predicted ester cyclase